MATRVTTSGATRVTTSGADRVTTSASAFTNDGARAGVNLESLRYWGRAIPFLNVLKGGCDVLDHRPSDNTWDAGRGITTNSDGYPTTLIADQEVTLLLATEQIDNWPSGNYTLRFDGDGGWTGATNASIEVTNFGSIVSELDGEITISWTPTDANQYIRIVAVNGADPIINMRLLLPGHTAETATFHPDFLTLLDANFQVLRFMDWQNTNNSLLATTADDTATTHITYGDGEDDLPGGVPLAIMVDLCNATNCDFWYCVPHLVNDAYVTAAATYVAANLTSTLRCFVEYSNETWNSKFDQKDYCTLEGASRSLDVGGTQVYGGNRRFMSERSQECFDLFEAQLAVGQTVRVLGGHAADDANNVVMMDWAHSTTTVVLSANCDHLATGNYFGGNLGTEPQATTSAVSPYTQTTVTMTAAQVVAAAVVDSEGRIEGFNSTNYANVTSRSMGLIAYESGQHLVGVGTAENNATLTALLTDANHHADIQLAYYDHFTRWETVGGGLTMPFQFTKRPGQKTGNWGLLDYMAQPAASSPKWSGYQDWLNASAPVAPVAEFSGTPLTGTPTLNVVFTDESTNTPTSWLWDFGDATTSTDRNPTKAYANPGTYTVTLTATNGGGADAEIKTDYITVNAASSAPGAEFSGTPLSGTPPLAVTFTDASVDSPSSWLWDFGDGIGTSTEQNPTYTYNAIGFYSVTLTATNDAGSDSITKSAYVSIDRLSGVRLDDAEAAINVLLNSVLSVQSPVITLHLDGVASQPDGVDGDVGSTAFLTLDLRAETETGPESSLRGVGVLEMTLQPQTDNAYWHNEVAAALRGTLEGANLPVYGKVSGTPLVLQGVLNITGFNWQVTSDTAGQIFAEVEIEIQERR